MSEIVLYHNPRCSKSRQALQLLQERGCTPRIVLYLDNPPTGPEMFRLLHLLDMPARQLLRTGEEAYREQGLAAAELDDEALVAAMVETPKLIERPIAVRGDKAVVGRPPERVLELL